MGVVRDIRYETPCCETLTSHKGVAPVCFLQLGFFYKAGINVQCRGETLYPNGKNIPQEYIFAKKQ
jgi:hypothetical protein